MGSLMSGWSSTVLGDDKKVRLMRNRSLTKEEVDAFWRQRGRPEPDHNAHQRSSPLGSPRVSDAGVSPLLPSPGRGSELQQESAFEARGLDGRTMIRSLPAPPLARDGRRFFPRSEPSSPAAQQAEGFPTESSSAAAYRPNTSCDWWTRSNWAFLNEPSHNKQHVAEGQGAQRPRV